MRQTQGQDISFADMLWRMSPQSIEGDRPTFEWEAAPLPQCDKALGLGECRVCTRDERMRRRAA